MGFLSKTHIDMLYFRNRGYGCVEGPHLWSPRGTSLPPESTGWDWTTTKNLNTGSYLLWATAVASYGANIMRGASGGSMFTCC